MAMRTRVTRPASALLAAPVLATLCLAGCGGSRTTVGPAQTNGTTESNYILGPGDNISITVYRAPELSVSLPVRPDGKISTPLIPDMPAAGKTPTQLGHDLEAKLKDYVKTPNVTVIVMGFVGPFDRQIRVIGEATQPLALPYRDHMTLLDVIIEAKGLTRFAAGNNAEIIRRNGAETDTIHVRLGDLIRDGDITKNVAMQPGDTLIIPQTWF